MSSLHVPNGFDFLNDDAVLSYYKYMCNTESNYIILWWKTSISSKNVDPFLFPRNVSQNTINWLKSGFFFKWREVCFHYLVPFLSMPFSHYERVVDHLLLMTYGLKQSLEAWILKFKKLHFDNSNFFCKA